jgi:tRNA(Ile)-lysidine synthase
MARLGPYGAHPRLGVAVSGGADSTALALLAQGWAAQNQGTIRAFIVDHGLRPESAAQAALTAGRLQIRGIASEILTLSGLSGPAIQEKARIARYDALATAAMQSGYLHLLLGHHAADQAETVTMRLARGPHGAEGIAPWSARNKILLLRPLLTIQHQELRAYLAATNTEWIEDPSNQNPKFERVRIRQAGTTAQPAAPAHRQRCELEAATFLARYASIRPEGFALLDAPAAPPAALAALIRTLGGASHPPRRDALAGLAAKLRPATLGGVRILAAGRLGNGWLLIREPAALAAPIPAHSGTLWDDRFMLSGPATPDQIFGALGAAAGEFKNHNHLPTAILRTMPCLRNLAGDITFPTAARFAPPAPVTSHPFFS